MRSRLARSLSASLVIVACIAVAITSWNTNRTFAAGSLLPVPAADRNVSGQYASLPESNGMNSLATGQTDRPTTRIFLPVVEQEQRRKSRTATPTPLVTKTATPTAIPATPTNIPAVAPGGPVYWGAYISGVPWDMSLQDAFEANTRKRVSIIHWGQPWIHNGAFQPFYTGNFEAVRARGAIPLLDWGSWDYSLGATQADYQLSDIYNGTYDNFIRDWATGARNWGHPLFLRFDWEMNGWWQFPWSEQLNGNRPGDYIKAWQHVHDIFANVGATNVAWVWCPNIVGTGTTSLTSLYPGDAYVDWVGMDGYNWGTNKGNTWQSFSQVFAPTYQRLLQLAPSKPIMIAETASSESGGSKAAWITDALKVQLPTAFPRIKAFVWFNWNDNDPALDWPVTSSQSSIDAFAAGIANTYYAANNFANAGGALVPPGY